MPDAGTERLLTLASLQTALARLCTDAPLRRAFFEDPVRVGAERLNLSPEEARRCAEFVPGEVARFADSLLVKRRNECRKQIPLVSQTLGSEFAPLFAEFARTRPRPETRVRHQDALEFCRWLAASSSAALAAEVRGAARYEAVALRLRQDEGRPAARPRFRMALLSFRMKPHGPGESPSHGNVRIEKGLTLAVWIAAGPDRIYHRLIALR